MSSRPGQGELVAYLDFDGALHPSDVHFDSTRCYFRSVTGHELFEHAALLEDVLEPFQEVQLVLSTRWVYLFGLEAAVAFLPPRLARRVIGSTLDFATAPNWDQMARGKQVLDDVAARQPSDWVALDDDVTGWPREHRKRLVGLNGELGLSEPAAVKRLSRLLLELERGARRRRRFAMRRTDGDQGSSS